MKKIEFINRKREIEDFEKEIQKKGKRIIFLEGQGGVGKTRFLEYILKEWKNQKYHVIKEIFDFEDRLLLEYGTFTMRLSEYSDYPINKDFSSKESDASSHDPRFLSEHDKEWFIGSLEQSSRKKPIIFLVDTTEKAQEDALVEIKGLIDKFESKVLIIFSGRESDREGRKTRNFVENVFSDIPSSTIILGPFDDLSVEKYLNAKIAQNHKNIISPVVKKNIVRYSHGKPVFVDLSYEYVDFNIFHDPLFIDESHHEIENSNNKYRKILVSFIDNFPEPIRSAILLLAHSGMPHDFDAMKVLVDKFKKKHFNRLLGMGIIKNLQNDTFITLHDEIQELVELELWENVITTERREFSRRLSKYYLLLDPEIESEIELYSNKGIENLSRDEFNKYWYLQNLRSVNTDEQVKHALLYNPEKTYTQLNVLFRQLRYAKKYKTIRRILNRAKLYVDSVPSHLGREFDFWEARQLVDEGNRIKAIEFLVDLLQKYQNDNDFEFLAKVSSSASVNFTYLGDWDNALRYQKNCISFLEKMVNNSKTIHYKARAFNWLGYIYRSMTHLDEVRYRNEALRYYNDARECVNILKNTTKDDDQKENEPLKYLEASIYNNLAYLHRVGQKKQLDRAILLCETAERLRKELKDDYGLAHVYLTLGIIERDKGNNSKSIDLLKRALRISNPKDGVKLEPNFVTRLYYHLGWSEWFSAEDNNSPDISLFERALESVNLAEQYAKEFSVTKELPGILHQKASILWRLGFHTNDKKTMKRGREVNIEAINISKGIGRDDDKLGNMNIRYLIDAVAGEFEFEVTGKKFIDDSLIDYLKSLVEDPLVQNNIKNFPFYDGRIDRYWAEIFILNGDFDLAKEYYKTAILKINKHGGYGPYTTKEELETLLNFLRNKLEPGEAVSWLKYFKQEWAEEKELEEWSQLQRDVYFS